MVQTYVPASDSSETSTKQKNLARSCRNSDVAPADGLGDDNVVTDASVDELGDESEIDFQDDDLTFDRTYVPDFSNNDDDDDDDDGAPSTKQKRLNSDQSIQPVKRCPYSNITRSSIVAVGYDSRDKNYLKSEYKKFQIEYKTMKKRS